MSVHEWARVTMATRHGETFEQAANRLCGEALAAFAKSTAEMVAPDPSVADWFRSRALPDAALDLLGALTAEERLAVFGRFCRYCGSPQTDPPCQCWNDE